MAIEHIKSLIALGTPRTLGWEDARGRSPKAMDDFSGVILSRIGTQRLPQVQSLDYELLSKIYICNDMAWTCMNLVSSTAALAKLKVRKRVGTDVTYLPDHPLQQLLDFPNSSMTQFDLIQAYVIHQLLYGNVTMLLLREGMTKMCKECTANDCSDCIHKLFLDTTSKIQQIMPVHPSNLIQRISPTDGQKYFFYKPNTANGLEYLIHPSNMISDPLYNPDIGWYGVSPTHLLQRWLNLDEIMTAQVTSYFENNAIPSMLVSLNPSTNYSYEDEPKTLVDKMKQGWMKQFSNSGNFGRGGTSPKGPAFLYGDIKVQKIQENIDQQLGKSLYYEVENHVCATYGVPPNLYEMGLQFASRGTTSAQAEQDFYNRTISKILSRIEKKITNILLPQYKEKGLEVSWDLSEVGIANFLLDRKENRTLNHWKLGLIKRNEARILLNYNPVEDEFADDYYRITVMGDGQGNVAGNQLTPDTPSDNNLTDTAGE